jgi:hypothetical protein
MPSFLMGGSGMQPGANGRVSASPHTVVPDPAYPHHVLTVQPYNGDATTLEEQSRYPFTLGQYVSWTPYAEPVALGPGGPSLVAPVGHIGAATVFQVELLLASLDMVGAAKADTIGPFLMRCLRRSPQFQHGDLAILESTDPIVVAIDPMPTLRLVVRHEVYAAKPAHAPTHHVVIQDEQEEGGAQCDHTLYWDHTLFEAFCTLGTLSATLYHIPPELGAVAVDSENSDKNDGA